MYCFYYTSHVYIVQLTLHFPSYFCVSQMITSHTLYGRKLCFWRRTPLWNRHKNLTEVLGVNGKNFVARIFRQCGQIKSMSQSTIFVAYCAHEIKRHVRSIPSILSALRHGMVSRLVKCCNAFDNELLNPSNKALRICQLRCIGHGCLVRSK